MKRAVPRWSIEALISLVYLFCVVLLGTRTPSKQHSYKERLGSPFKGDAPASLMCHEVLLLPAGQVWQKRSIIQRWMLKFTMADGNAWYGHMTMIAEPSSEHLCWAIFRPAAAQYELWCILDRNTRRFGDAYEIYVVPKTFPPYRILFPASRPGELRELTSGHTIECKYGSPGSKSFVEFRPDDRDSAGESFAHTRQRLPSDPTGFQTKCSSCHLRRSGFDRLVIVSPRHLVCEPPSGQGREVPGAEIMYHWISAFPNLEPSAKLYRIYGGEEIPILRPGSLPEAGNSMSVSSDGVTLHLNNIEPNAFP
jgi:hypothetical protein